VSSLGRNTQGVTLIKLANDETLVGLERVQEPSEVEGDELEDEDGEVLEGAVLDAATDSDDAVEGQQADAAGEEESQD